MPYFKRLRGRAAVAIFLCQGTTAYAVAFDPDILRERGLGLDTAEYFSESPRLRPGMQMLTVRVNGRDLGRRPVRIDEHGNFCLTAEFADAIGLRLPATPAPTECAGRAAPVPQLESTLHPADASIALIVPPAWLSAPRKPEPLRGGIGALLNYRGFTLNSRTAGGPSQSFSYLDSEIGLNADDWILRARMNQSQSNGQDRSRWSGAYAQKTFVEQEAVFQSGLLTTLNPLYAGIPLTGAQWFPEQGLRRQAAAPLVGMAFSRARVEIRQSGILLHTTLVPPGPFTLTDYQPVNYSADIEMRVFEESGESRVVRVPASSLLQASGQAQRRGLTVAGGRLRNLSDDRATDEKWMGTAAYTLHPTPSLDLTLGGLGAEQYHAVGLAGQWRASPRASALLRLTSGADLKHRRHGVSLNAAVASQPTADWSLGLSATGRSRDYRSVLEAAHRWPSGMAPAFARSQVSAHAMRTGGWLRGLSGSVTRQDVLAGRPVYLYAVSWGTVVRGASLQLALARTDSTPAAASASGAGAAPGTWYGRGRTSAQVSLSVPLGGRATSTSYLRSDGGTRHAGTAVEQSLTDSLAYRASVERESGASGRDHASQSLSASVRPRYTALNLGISRSGRSQSVFAEASGSVIATPAGVAFAPYAARDSYALARVGDLSGIRIDTPQGPVWSGPRGLAAVPSLLPFQESRLEIATRTVPRDVDIDRGLVVVRAGRGAVLHIDMGARQVRRVLLSIQDGQGRPLPAGLAVLRDGAFAAATDGRGRVLVDLPQPATGWTVLLGGGRRCALDAVDAPARRPDARFALGHATCKDL